MIAPVVNRNVRVVIFFIQLSGESLRIFAIRKRTDLKGKIARVKIDRFITARRSAIGGGRCGQGNHLDSAGAGTDDPDIFGCCVGQINDSASHKGSPIVNPHLHPTIVFKVMNPHESAQRQGFVGCGHGIHIVNFTVGGFLAVEILAVPGSDPALAETFRVRQRLIPFAKHFIGFRVTGWLFGRWGSRGAATIDMKNQSGEH